MIERWPSCDSDADMIPLCWVCDWFEVSLMGKCCVDCGIYMAYKLECKVLVAFAKHRRQKEIPS